MAISRKVTWYRKPWVRGLVIGTVAVLGIGETALLFSGRRIAVSETLVQPGQTYWVAGFGDVGKQAQASLVCRYFTGRSITTNVLWYSSTNQMGRDECSFVASADAEAGEGGSLADWVSGIGSMLAVFVALLGYFIVERHRRNDAREVKQGQIYQIGYKLSTMASEVRTTLRDLNQKQLPLDELIAEDNPFVIVGSQAPIMGYDRTMVRDLSDAEQNLLMLVREEEFLMNFSECVARNESVRSSFVEYGKRREELLARLPAPEEANGQTGSFGMTQADQLALFPYITPAATLIRQARYLAKMNVEMVTKLCDDFMPKMKGHFPNYHVHKIELVEIPPGAPNPGL